MYRNENIRIVYDGLLPEDTAGYLRSVVVKESFIYWVETNGFPNDVGEWTENNLDHEPSAGRGRFYVCTKKTKMSDLTDRSVFFGFLTKKNYDFFVEHYTHLVTNKKPFTMLF